MPYREIAASIDSSDPAAARHTSSRGQRPLSAAEASGVRWAVFVAVMLALALGGTFSAHSVQAATMPARALIHISFPQAVAPAPIAVPQSATIRDQTGLPDPCLAVNKDVDKATANTGGMLTYTLTVTDNTNPEGALSGFPCADAINPSLIDQADNGVQFISGSLTVTPPSAFNCNLSSGTVQCTAGTVHTTDSIVVSFQAKVTGCGSTSNYATFTAANFIAMIPPFFFTQIARSNGVVTTINCPDLTISKTLAPDTNVPALIGGTVHYQIVVKNQGLAPAQGVTITDPVPAGYAFASASTGIPSPAAGNALTACSYSSATTTVTCGGSTPPSSTLNTLNADPTGTTNQSVTVDLYLTVVNCQLGPNTATVASSTPESDFNGATDTNNSATAPPPAVKCPDLTITKTASAGTVPSGGTFTYSITVTNTGNAAVQPTGPAEPPIIVTDTLPAGLQLVGSPTGSGWSCAANPSTPSTLSCTWTGQGAGGAGGLDLQQPTGPIQVMMRAPALNPSDPSQQFCNTAAVNGAVDSGGTFAPFHGPTPAPVPETSYGDNTSQICVTVSPPSAAPEPNLSIDKRQDVTSVPVGSYVTYSITVRNTGTIDAANVTMIDALPANTTLAMPVTVSPGVLGFACDMTVQCTGGVVPAGDTVTFTIVVQVESCGATARVVNQASVHGSDGDDDDVDPLAHAAVSQSVTATVVGCPVLTVSKTVDNAGPVNSNALLTYKVTVGNAGDAGVTNVMLTDTLSPASSIGSFWSFSPSQGSCDAPSVSGSNSMVTCQLGNLAPGAQATLTLVVQLGGGSPSCTFINTATAKGTINGTLVNATVPPGSTNHVSTALYCPALTVTKTFVRTDSGTAGPIVPNTHTVWQIAVQNTSATTPAFGVQVTDAFDHPEDIATVTAATSSGTCTPAAQRPPGPAPQVTCTIGTLSAGQSVTIMVDALILGSPPACELNDTATVTDSNGNTSPNLATATLPATVNGQPNQNIAVNCTSLALTKIVSPSVTTPGNTVTYKLTVTNPSVSTVSGVTVADSLNAALSLQTGSINVAGAMSGLSCAASTAAQLNCSEGTLPGGQTATITFSAHVASASSACGSIANTATVSGTAFSGQLISASTPSSASLRVQCPDLTISKSGPSTVDGDQAPNAVYHILIGNAGDFTAAPVLVVDHLPAGVTAHVSPPESTSTPGWSCTGIPSDTDAFQSGSHTNIACSLNALPPGGQAVLDLGVTFNPPARMVTNVAIVDPNNEVLESNKGNNQASFTTTIASSPLFLSNTCTAVMVSTDSTCVVGVSNTGPDDATNVTVGVPVPAGTTLVSATSTSGACDPTATCNLGTLGGANVSAQVSLVFNVNSCGAKPVPATVQGTVSGGSTGNSVTAMIPVTCNWPDLALTKTCTPVNVGANSTCTLTVTNDGTADASNVQVTDTSPVGTAVVSVTASSGGFSCDTTVTCTGGSVTGRGGTVVLTVVLTVNTCGDKTNLAQVQAVPGETNLSNNSATATMSVSCNRPDLAVTKTCTSVNVGTNSTCIVTVTNGGTANAAGVVVTDTPPADTTVVSATASGNGFSCDKTVSCTGGSLAAGGGQATITVVLTVKTCGDKANTAQVQPATGETNLTNNSATTTMSVSCNRPDLDVTKTCTAVTVGANTTCTITVTNNGTADAATVVVADTVPANTSLVSATASQGSCDTSVSCNIGTLTAGRGQATITVVLTVTTCGDKTNTARAQQVTGETNLTNNAATATISVTCTRPDLGITKSCTAANVGANTTCTITVTNSGTADAVAVHVTDTPPADTVVVSATASGSGFSCDKTVSCSGGSLAAGGGQATITVVLTVKTCGDKANTAQVQPATGETNLTNNSATATISVTCTHPDLSVTKTCTPVNVGTNSTCTITVTNGGTADATGVVITDTPPADTTVVSATASGNGLSCDKTVSCTGGSLAAGGGQATITVVLTVKTCGDKANTAQVQPATGETNLTNNSATTTISVTCTHPDLGVTLTCTPVNVGGTSTCTITVPNSGTADASGVVVTDTPPADTTVVSATASGSGFSCDKTVRCSGGSLAAGGGQATITVVLTVNTCGDKSDTAQVQPAPGQTSLANVSATVTMSVSCNRPDLGITKSCAPAVVGTTSQCALVVINSGTAVATGVVVTDAAPPGTTVVSAGAKGSGFTCDTTVRCSGSTLAANGGQATIIVVLTINTCGDKSNTAQVQPALGETNLANNSATVTITVSCTGVDVGLTKTCTPAAVGANATCTLTVTDNGTIGASGVIVTDTAPAGTTIVSATPHGSGFTCDTTVRCSAGTLAANGGQATITVVLTINTCGVKSNIALVEPLPGELSLADNAASAAIGMPCPQPSGAPADLGIAKACTAAPVGGKTVCGLGLTNSGATDASGVVVTDTLPAGTSLVSATASGGGFNCDATVMCSGGSLAASGSQATITVVLTVNTCGDKTNTAKVQPAPGETNLANNSATATITVSCTHPDLAISMTCSSSGTYPQTRCTLTLSNDGTADASGIALTETVPADATVVSVTPSDGGFSCDTSISCSGGSLAAGRQTTITVAWMLSFCGARSTTAQVQPAPGETNLANHSVTTTFWRC